MKKTSVDDRRKRILIALVLSSYLVVGIDGSLVITAIAEIASDLHMGSMAECLRPCLWRIHAGRWTIG